MTAMNLVNFLQDFGEAEVVFECNCNGDTEYEYMINEMCVTYDEFGEIKKVTLR